MTAHKITNGWDSDTSPKINAGDSIRATEKLNFNTFFRLISSVRNDGLCFESVDLAGRPLRGSRVLWDMYSTKFNERIKFLNDEINRVVVGHYLQDSDQKRESVRALSIERDDLLEKSNISKSQG